MKRSRRNKRRKVLVPVASMGDIAFLLIIFFLLASEFARDKDVPIQLPTAQQVKKTEAVAAARVAHPDSPLLDRQDGVAARQLAVREDDPGAARSAHQVVALAQLEAAAGAARKLENESLDRRGCLRRLSAGHQARRQAHRRRGAPGLTAKAHPGRPSRLTTRQKTLLRQRLLKGAQANGFSGDLWTCPRVVELIERHYGVRYHVDHIPRLLASLGWSCQRPQKRAIERDQEAITRWIQRDWARIKKKRPVGELTSSSSMNRAS